MFDRVREDDSSRSDEDAKLMMAFVQERWPSRCHLVQEDSEGPPIDTEAVPTHVQNFWRQVLRRPTEGVGLVARLQELGEAKIC